MSARSLHRLLLLPLALGVLGACNRGGSPQGVSRDPLAPLEAGDGPGKGVQKANGSSPSAQRTAPPPPVSPLIAHGAVPSGEAKVHLGMSRAEFVTEAHGCLNRVLFLRPGRRGGRAVELFEPRDAECLKYLGPRRFRVSNDRLDEISPAQALTAEKSPGAPEAIPEDRDHRTRG